MTEPTKPAETLKITSESLANGRCANCFRPIYRVPGNNLYRHRHNHSDECMKTPDKELFVQPLLVNDGETMSVILMMCVKKIAKLIVAHNALAVMVEEIKKERVSIIEKIGPNTNKIVSFERNFIGSTPRITEVPEADIEHSKRIMIDVAKHSMNDVERRAFYIQWKWFCKCVAPVPVAVTGSGHIPLCDACKKPIIEDDND